MATPVIHLEEINQFDALLTKIEEIFSFFHSLLDIQQISLVERVEKMKEIYQQHQKLSEAIEQLVRKATNEMLKGDLVAGNKNDVVRIYDEKIKQLKRNKSDLKQVSALKFLDNGREFSECVKRIHLREEAVEYKRRREPLVMKGKRGFNEGEVIEPQGIAIDDTNNEVFVVDCYKALVCVYSSEGDFIRKFGNEKLNGSYGICLSGKSLFVSSLTRSIIYKFTKTGEFLRSTSLEGENAIELKNPKGLCVNNNFVYICNNGQNRIEVLKLDLTFVTSFKDAKNLEYPQDIKIFHNQILVLTQFFNTINIFTDTYTFLRSIYFTELHSQICNSSQFFTIDNKVNFIVSDFEAGCLKIFDPLGKKVGTLGDGFLTVPRGVAIDNQLRIVVINQSKYSTFQKY